MRRLTTLAAVALAGVTAVTGCSKNNGGMTSTGTGHVSLALTDAPSADLSSAVVTISKIYLVGNAADSTNANGQVVLMSTPVTTDLLTLSNNLQSLVDSATVPAGTYSQLRFVVDGAYITVASAQGNMTTYATQGYQNAPPNAVGTLKCPSCSQSGIKVNLNGGVTVAAGQQTDLLVDFNVSDTFGHQAGQSGMWVMHPTLNATQTQLAGTVNVSLSLADTVTLPTIGTQALTLGDFKAELKSATADPTSTGVEIPFTASSDSTASATYHYVVPGDYIVTVVGPDTVTFTTAPDSQAVTVGSGATASAHLTLTSIAVVGGG